MVRSHLRPLASLVLLGLLPGGALAQPWIDGWSHRVPFSAESAQIEPGPFTDFPLLLSLDDLNHPGVFQHAKADGTDLFITGGDGTTLLDREVVAFDTTGGVAEIWFRAPTLSSTENDFYLYYGNPDTTWGGSATAAWNANYRAVYHFDDDPGLGVLSDSSPVQTHATLNPARMWGSGDVQPGQIHQAWTFNGSTGHVNNTGISTQSGNYVIGAWLLHTSRSTDFFVQTSPGFWHVSSQNTSEGPDFAAGQGAAGWDPRPMPINDGFHHFAWVFDADADTILFYYDGEAQELLGTFPPDLSPIYTGEPMNPNNTFPVGIVGPMGFIVADLMHGAADEFRVHEGLLSPEWMKTEVNNQGDPLGFFSFGSQETAITPVQTVHPGGTLLLSRPNPFQGATSIQFSLARGGPVRLTVYDVAGREVVRLVDEVMAPGRYQSRWEGVTAAGRTAASGVYFLRLSTPHETRATKLLLVR